MVFCTVTEGYGTSGMHYCTKAVVVAPATEPFHLVRFQKDKMKQI